MKKKMEVAGAPALDPTLPKVSLELAGETFHLCYDYAALAIAERKLRESGQQVNMLLAMNVFDLDAEKLPHVFFAGLLRSHPDITFAKAGALITMETYPPIYGAVLKAYFEACPSFKEKKKQGDPTEEPAA